MVENNVDVAKAEKLVDDKARPWDGWVEAIPSMAWNGLRVWADAHLPPARMASRGVRRRKRQVRLRCAASS
eukprot:2574181-Lingulodinium_polyedra.AAC.1